MQTRLKRLDLRLTKENAERRVGMNIEKLRQMLFPFGKPQERVLPGWYWLQNDPLLDKMEKALERRAEKYIIYSGSI